MPIDGLPPIGRTQPRKLLKSASAPGFASSFNNDHISTPAIRSGPAEVHKLFLTLQEAHQTCIEPADRRSDIETRTERALSALSDLQVRLLGNQDLGAALERLSCEVNGLPEPRDAEEAALIGLVRLRAAIEIARHAARAAA